MPDESQLHSVQQTENNCWATAMLLLFRGTRLHKLISGAEPGTSEEKRLLSGEIGREEDRRALARTLERRGQRNA